MFDQVTEGAECVDCTSSTGSYTCKVPPIQFHIRNQLQGCVRALGQLPLVVDATFPILVLN